jgi:hypothetical protein
MEDLEDGATVFNQRVANFKIFERTAGSRAVIPREHTALAYRQEVCANGLPHENLASRT